MARSIILKEVPEGTIELAQLDVSSIASVHPFAKAWSGPLHLLVLNAGTVSTRKIASLENHEMTYATNALCGGFLFTLKLLPFMPDEARIVFNSSVASYDIPPLSASQVDSSDLLGRIKIGDELEMRMMILLCAPRSAFLC